MWFSQARAYKSFLNIWQVTTVVSSTLGKEKVACFKEHNFVDKKCLYTWSWFSVSWSCHRNTYLVHGKQSWPCKQGAHPRAPGHILAGWGLNRVLRLETNGEGWDYKQNHRFGPLAQHSWCDDGDWYCWKCLPLGSKSPPGFCVFLCAHRIRELCPGKSHWPICFPLGFNMGEHKPLFLFLQGKRLNKARQMRKPQVHYWIFISYLANHIHKQLNSSYWLVKNLLMSASGESSSPFSKSLIW